MPDRVSTRLRAAVEIWSSAFIRDSLLYMLGARTASDVTDHLASEPCQTAAVVLPCLCMYPLSRQDLAVKTEIDVPS